MRIIVFFDLPVETSEDRRNYRKFRKILVKNGFIMMQESVYCRMITSPSVENSIFALIQNNKPPRGVIQSLVVTERQFSNMKYIVGNRKDDIIDSAERLIIL